MREGVGNTGSWVSGEGTIERNRRGKGEGGGEEVEKSVE